MSSLGLNPALLYKTAVFINAISIPGHVALGLQLVHPGLNAIASSKTAGADESGKKVAVKRSAQACFNYINGSLLIAGTHSPTALDGSLVQSRVALIPVEFVGFWWTNW